MDYHTAFKKYKGYMSQIAISTNNWDNLNSKADIMQELSIVLWNCLEKYRNTDDKQLEKILKSAFHNKIGNLLVSKRIERQGLVSIDNKDPKGKKFAEGFTQHIMTDKDYENGINDILASIPADSAMKIMDVLNPVNRGVFIKGTRKAYGEVESYLRKD